MHVAIFRFPMCLVVLMRFAVPVNARLARRVAVDEARRVLFGPERGLPGERWWTRPLVARDMLHWYFPSKYGLPDFRLSDYYEMQAERFGQRPVRPWVPDLRDLVNTIHSHKDEISTYLKSIDHEEWLGNEAAQDLHAVYVSLGGYESPLSFSDGVHALSVSNEVHAEFTQELSSIVKQVLLATPRTTHTQNTPEPSSPPSTPIRFVDPLFRRRRLKWMERFLAGMNNAKEIKYNRHFTRNPNLQERWPTNLGSVTVRWPNRRN